MLIVDVCVARDVVDLTFDWYLEEDVEVRISILELVFAQYTVVVEVLVSWKVQVASIFELDMYQFS